MAISDYYFQMCDALPGREGLLNFNLMCENLPVLLKGVPLTLELVFISLSLGFCLAIGVALMRISNSRTLNIIARSYVFYFRGTPLLVQIFSYLLWFSTI